MDAVPIPNDGYGVSVRSRDLYPDFHLLRVAIYNAAMYHKLKPIRKGDIRDANTYVGIKNQMLSVIHQFLKEDTRKYELAVVRTRRKNFRSLKDSTYQNLEFKVEGANKSGKLVNILGGIIRKT